MVYTPECPRERGPWRELRSRDQNFKFMATSVCVAGLSLDEDHRLHGDVLRYVAESPWFGDSHSVARTAGDAAVWTPRVETDVATAVRDWSTLALGSETAHARSEGPVNEESEHQATADRQRRPVQATLRSKADPPRARVECRPIGEQRPASSVQATSQSEASPRGWRNGSDVRTRRCGHLCIARGR